MIDRQKGKILFECDACDEVLDTETEDFEAAREAFHAEGWTAVKGDRGFEHYCKRCSA